MNYSTVRHELKSGDIVFWSHTDWRSKNGILLNIVRVFTKSNFGHVALVWRTGGRIFLIEAAPPLVRIVPLSDRLPCYIARIPFTVNRETINYALSQVGKPYSKWEAIKAFFNKNTDGESNWECAKLVNKVLGKIKPDFESVQDTPSKLFQHLVKKYNIHLIYLE